MTDIPDPLDPVAARKAQLERLDEYERLTLVEMEVRDSAELRETLADIRDLRARILGGPAPPTFDGHDIVEGPPLEDPG